MPRITFISNIETDPKDSEIQKNSTIHKNSTGVEGSGNHYDLQNSIQKQNQSHHRFCFFDFDFGFAEWLTAIGLHRVFGYIGLPISVTNRAVSNKNINIALLPSFCAIINNI